MLRIKKLLQEINLTPMEEMVIEQMLSDAYADMQRKCIVLPKEWKTAFEALFKELKE